MHPFWSGVAFAEHAAIAGAGAANAAYFAHRGYRARGARRLGAVLLTVLFAAISLDALAAVALSEPGGGRAMSALDAALREERYEAAALRLLLGVLRTLDATAPDTRDEMVALLSVERP